MMDTIISPLFGIITALVTGLFVWVAALTTKRGQKQAEEIKANGPNWSAFTERLQAQIDAQGKSIVEARAEAEEARARAASASDEARRAWDESQEARAELREVKEEMSKVRAAFYSAIDHIREWRKRYPHDPLVLNPPESLKHEL